MRKLTQTIMTKISNRFLAFFCPFLTVLIFVGICAQPVLATNPLFSESITGAGTGNYLGWGSAFVGNNVCYSSPRLNNGTVTCRNGSLTGAVTLTNTGNVASDQNGYSLFGKGNILVSTSVGGYQVGNTLPRVKIFKLDANGVPVLKTTYTSPANDGVGDIAIADLDNDGNPEVIVGFQLSSLIRVFKENTNGTWSLFQTFTDNNVGKTIAFVDYNHDGYPDLVTATGAPTARQVKIFLNNHGVLTNTALHTYVASAYNSFSNFGDNVKVLTHNDQIILAISDLQSSGNNYAAAVHLVDAVSGNALNTLYGQLGNSQLGFAKTMVTDVDVNGDGWNDVIISQPNFQTQFATPTNPTSITPGKVEVYSGHDLRTKLVDIFNGWTDEAARGSSLAARKVGVTTEVLIGGYSFNAARGSEHKIKLSEHKSRTITFTDTSEVAQDNYSAAVINNGVMASGVLDINSAYPAAKVLASADIILPTGNPSATAGIIFKNAATDAEVLRATVRSNGNNYEVTLRKNATIDTARANIQKSLNNTKGRLRVEYNSAGSVTLYKPDGTVISVTLITSTIPAVDATTADIKVSLFANGGAIDNVMVVNNANDLVAGKSQGLDINAVAGGRLVMGCLVDNVTGVDIMYNGTQLTPDVVNMWAYQSNLQDLITNDYGPGNTSSTYREHIYMSMYQALIPGLTGVTVHGVSAFDHDDIQL